MFSAIWAWIVGVCNALLKRCIKACVQQWYLVETRTAAKDDWSDRYPTHCHSLRAAKEYLVATTDTYFWIKCRILDPDGNVVDESVANDFYCVSSKIADTYVKTDMTCAAAVEAWRQQTLESMDSRECCRVKQ